jgi:two-component system chemotaxis sensor kinase CheA
MNYPDPIAVFRTEAAELLEAIEAGLLDLLDNLSDKEQIDAVFRSLHTLKGSGAMFGFEALAAFTHHCETAFDLVRKGEVPATEPLVSAVLETQGHMRTLVEIPGGNHDAQSAKLLEQLHQAVEAARTGGEMPVAAGAKVLHRRVKFSLPANTMSNGTNPLALLDELRDLGECSISVDRSAIPALSAMDPSALYVTWTVDLKSAAPRSAIEDVFIFVMDDMELDISVVEGAEEPAAAAPVAAAAKPAPEARPVPEFKPVAAVPAAMPSSTAANAPAAVDAKAARAAENVRVPAERLDELMDRVGELVIAQSRLSQLAGASGDIQLRAVSEDIERLSGELRDTMMVLRMVPVTQLFGRFRRLVHDLAHETGKTIELITEGESTEVDKSVIERLADPLVHLVRNSCDHGLETAQERIAAGKPAAGHVTLSARQTGGEVRITISDDGRGINR